MNAFLWPRVTASSQIKRKCLTDGSYNSRCGKKRMINSDRVIHTHTV